MAMVDGPDPKNLIEDKRGPAEIKEQQTLQRSVISLFNFFPGNRALD